MNIAMIGYPTYGGSGVVATELAKQLAVRGHQVHFISSEVPVRLTRFEERLHFHPVDTPSYYLFKHPPYTLAVASKAFEVWKNEGIDILHAHYAVPHAISGLLARMMAGGAGPRVVTTLHGTDITLVGQEPSFRPAVELGLQCSDAVTAVSGALRAQTIAAFNVRDPQRIRVIPNFVDASVFRPGAAHELRTRFADAGEALLIHVSNLRPVKRVDWVLRILHGVNRTRPTRLLLVGDGPEMGRLIALAEELSIRERVHFLGSQSDVAGLLAASDLFILPSAQESFGLASLEAMAAGVPVIASRAGGIPEVVEDGVTGILTDELTAMVDAAVELLADGPRRCRMGRAARRSAVHRFAQERIVPMYESLYEETLAGNKTAAG